MSGAPRHGGGKSSKEYAMAQDYDINIKVKGLGAAAKQLADFTDELNEAREEGASIGGALDKATGGAVTGFKKAAAGVKTFITGLKLTRGAIIATGIGALVVGVIALVSAFTKTEAGARKLKLVMAGLSAGVQFFTTRIEAAGGYLVNLFTKGHTAAAAEFNDALKDVDATLDGAISQAVRLEKAQQALIDRQIEMTKRRAEDRKDIKEYNMVAEDTTKSLEEREAAAKSAIEIEKALMAERLSIAQKEAEIHAERMSMGSSTEEDRMKQAELEAQVMDLQTESFEMQTTLNNKLNTIRQQAAAEAEAESKRIADAAEVKRKAEEEAAAAIIKAEQDVVDSLDKRSRANLSALENELLTIEDFYNTQLDAAGDNAQLQAQIEAQRDAEIQALFEKHSEVSIAQRDKLNEDLATRRLTEREKEIADHDATFYALMDAAGTNQEMRLAVLDQYATEVNEMQERHRQEDLANERAAAMARREIQVQTATQTLSILSNLNEAFSKGGVEQNKKAFNRNKAISIAETLVSTYMAAQKAFTSQLTATPDSPIRAAIAAAAATASGLARVAAIKSTSFNSGGGGSSSAGGGASIGGGGVQSVGVDVGSLVPNQQNPTPEPVRAYVVEKEISNKQALNRELQIQTTL